MSSAKAFCINALRERVFCDAKGTSRRLWINSTPAGIFRAIQAHESQRLISDSTAFSVLPVWRYDSKSPITIRIIVRDQGRALSSVVLPIHNTGVRTAAQQGHGPKFCCLQTTTGSFDWGLYVTRQHCFAIDVGATVIRSFSHATGVTWSLSDSSSLFYNSLCYATCFSEDLTTRPQVTLLGS